MDNILEQNIYIKLTEQFNSDRVRTIICSGQAVVLHRLAIMSKDGDWIIREEEVDCQHVLSVLAEYGATYRFGAPLDIRWLRAGWSSHFEFKHDGLRVRADFFSRPPRIREEELSQLWVKAESSSFPPFTDIKTLAFMKMTCREKDYAVIGELAKRMVLIEEKVLFSRSARDLVEFCHTYPSEVRKLVRSRALLAYALDGDIARLEQELDRERRFKMYEDEQRLLVYESSSKLWQSRWKSLFLELQGLNLGDAHRLMVSEALHVLPSSV